MARVQVLLEVVAQRDIEEWDAVGDQPAEGPEAAPVPQP